MNMAGRPMTAVSVTVRAPAPGDDQVGSAVNLVHIVDKGPGLRRGRDPLIGRLDRLAVHGAGLVHEADAGRALEAPLAHENPHRAHHGLVERAGALTAAHHQDHDFTVIIMFFRRHRRQIAPDGITGQIGPLTREKSAALLETDENQARHPAQQAVGHTRNGVLFLNGRGQAQHPGGQDHRTGNVTAHADDQIGFEIAD